MPGIAGLRLQLSQVDTCMKIRGRVVSLSFAFPHSREDVKRGGKIVYQGAGIGDYERGSLRALSSPGCPREHAWPDATALLSVYKRVGVFCVLL